MLFLLSIYGLRVSEVAGLVLEDFDWINETFTVRRAKRGRIQQFPIQFEVGEAILKYLQDERPVCKSRCVFVTLRPPFRRVGTLSIQKMVSARMKMLRVQSKKLGPHSLRHACATQLLRKGMSLPEIADFLGHRDLRSVSIYAKLDVRALRKVSNFTLMDSL
jgi:integrase